jgi:restriction system protein
MINRAHPTDWRDLQRQVSLILNESGIKSDVDKKIQTVRGPVNIDVYAEDLRTQPGAIYLCECKHWQSPVPKTVVHAFRTVVADFGANWGFIISSAGFQSGARIAAAKSNTKLLTWEAFQEMFTDRWMANYMVPRLREEVEPLWEYTEPINSRVFRKADKLDEGSQKRFNELREKYRSLGFLALRFFVMPEMLETERPELPLRKAYKDRKVQGPSNISEDLLDAESLRDFLEIICRDSRKGIAAFDQLFGGRA